MEAIQPLVINPTEGYVIMEDESEALIDMLIDDFGCPTDDPDCAAALVGRYYKPESKMGEWLFIEMIGLTSVEVPDAE